MMFTMPRYEVKYFDKENWEEISEKIALEKLSDAFYQLNPVLSDLLQGNPILTSEAIFRIKLNTK